MMRTIQECIERDRRLQAQLIEVCRRTGRSQLEVFRMGSDWIKEYHRELYEEMIDPNTPKAKRDLNKYHFVIEKFLIEFTRGFA
jgi:hypothetical protein